MPRSHFTIAFLLSFLALTGVLQWFQFPLYPKEVWLTLLLFALLGMWIVLLGGSRGPSTEPVPSRVEELRAGSTCLAPTVRREFGALLLCVVIGASLAFLRVAQTTHVENPDSIESSAVDCDRVDCWGKEAPVITLRGFIVDEPDRRPVKTRYTVEVEGDKILVTDYAAWPRHDYGDEVLVKGVLERPGVIEDFAYDRYLSRFDIYSITPRAEVTTLSSGHGYSFFTLLYHLKERFESQINRLYPEPHASFLAGLLTGSRRGIPEHLLTDFQRTGLTHIIAISGYNITIVLSILGSLLFFLPLRWRFLPSLLAILFFTLFVGASPSVVRAAIMGALGLFALHVGRQRHALIAILLAAFLMTVFNPKLLWYDAGFQLSFLSVLGLTYLSPFLERPCSVFPKAFGIRDSLQITIAAQLAAVPLVTLLFGQFSLVAPLANLFIAPLIPLAMLFGFLGVTLSFLSFPLGLFIAYLGWGALELIIRVAETFADLPYASFAVSSVQHSWVFGYYVVLLVFLTTYRRICVVPPSLSD